MAYGVSVLEFPRFMHDWGLSTYHQDATEMPILPQEEIFAVTQLHKQGFEIFQTKGEDVLLAKKGDETRIIVTWNAFNTEEWNLIASSGDVELSEQEAKEAAQLVAPAIMAQSVELGEGAGTAELPENMIVLFDLFAEIVDKSLTETESKYALRRLIVDSVASKPTMGDVYDRIRTPELRKPKV